MVKPISNFIALLDTPKHTAMPPTAQASSSKLKEKANKSKDKVIKKPVVDAAVDIDSIFSKPVKAKSDIKEGSNGKGKERANDTTAKPSIPGTSVGGLKKKKKAKTMEGNQITSSTTTKTKSIQPDTARVVEVIDDTIPKVKQVVEPVKAVKEKGKKRDKKEAEEDEMFADSRGTGPSMSTYSIEEMVSYTG
jgi:hypothetical protein